MLFVLAKGRICSAVLPIFAANLCRYASKSTQNPHPKPINSMMVDYLVASFGFTPDKAARLSKPIAHLKSPDKPEAVRRFLKQEGFSEADIKSIIALHPRLLTASPERTLAPNLCALRDIGLCTSTLTPLILSAPAVLYTSFAVLKIKFWRDFFQGNDTDLVTAFKKNTNLATHDISRSLSPKISLLRSHGLSIQDIQRILLKAPRFFTYRISSLEESLKRAEEFGFKPDSRMFVHGLHVMTSLSREVLQKRMKLLKSFGWSEDEFLSALCKAPYVVTRTEKCLQAKMDFLIGEAKCDPSYIASNPVLLMLSLEKRLRPRLHVMLLLESKGLSGKRRTFCIDIKMTDGEFVNRFILPHNEKISGLHEAYISACA